MPTLEGMDDVAWDYKHLAQAMVGRAGELGLLQEDVIRLSGLGRTTVQHLWAGNGKSRPSPRTRREVDRVMRWEEGSTLTALEGGEPTLLEDAEAPVDGEDVPVTRIETPGGVEHTEVRVVSGHVSIAGLAADLERASPADRRVMLRLLQALVDEDERIDKE